MTKYKVVLVPFPFDDLSSSKVRPAVCLTEPSDQDIFPFESGKTYHLPTPYNSYGAAGILAEAIVTYQEEDD